MKRQHFFLCGLCLLLGASAGYFLSLASSFKKSADALPALASALPKRGDFSEVDMVVILRMYRLSRENKAVHTDRSVVWYLARYYNERSKLTPAEQEALGASALLPKILELQESDPLLREAITKGRDAGGN